MTEIIIDGVTYALTRKEQPKPETPHLMTAEELVKPWIPGRLYFTQNEVGNIVDRVWYDWDSQRESVNCGNVHRTRAEAAHAGRLCRARAIADRVALRIWDEEGAPDWARTSFVARAEFAGLAHLCGYRFRTMEGCRRFEEAVGRETLRTIVTLGREAENE